MISGRRWLSLKNWASISFNEHVVSNLFTKNLIKKLIKLNIDARWIKDIDFKNVNISNKNARSSSTLFEAIEKECGVKVVKIIGVIFKNNVNSIIGLYKLIDANHIHKITNFVKDNKVRLEKLINNDSPDSYKNILYFYFLVKDNRVERGLFFDYVDMLEKRRFKNKFKHKLL